MTTHFYCNKQDEVLACIAEVGSEKSTIRSKLFGIKTKQRHNLRLLNTRQDGFVVLVVCIGNYILFKKKFYEFQFVAKKRFSAAFGTSDHSFKIFFTAVFFVADALKLSTISNLTQIRQSRYSGNRPKLHQILINFISHKR